MDTTVQTVATEPTTEQQPTKAKKARKSFTFGFAGPDGASLKLVLKLNKAGGATTYASHKPKGGKSTRGATEQHATLEKAEVALKKLVEKATKLGWERKERKGFQKTPDAFTEIPAAAKAKK
jgi:hypothetical protein